MENMLEMENILRDTEVSDKTLLSYYKSQLVLLQAELAVKDVMLEKKDEEISRLKKEARYYKNISTVDTLTGLKNRRAIENISDYDSLIMGDVDLFKKINDNYGHDTGDKVLKLISGILKKLVRDDDLVVRWGGEEFMILLKNCNILNAYRKASELRIAVSELSEELGFAITMSFGVTEISDRNANAKDILKEADDAMYESKRNGRNQVTIYQKTR